MSDQVTQKLGFDASDAIASIGNLNKSLAAMNTRFGDIAVKAQKFNGVGDQITFMLKRLDPAAAQSSKSLGDLSLKASAASASFARLAVSLKNATGMAQALNSTALGKLVANLDSASKAASQTVGGLNNIGVAATRAATGINKVGTGNLDALAKKTNDAAIAWRNLNWATRNAVNNPKLNTPKVPNPAQVQRPARVVVGPEVIGRVLQTQALLRGLGLITEAFHFAAETAVEFNAKVAEIRTISTVKDLGELKNQVASLAAEFNRPLTDVAEGYYQTLSNQVGNAVESTKFLSTALKFGKVAVTETGDSVNLLAGTIHAFNRPVEEAGDIAAKFFKTIELGRVRGSELANVYGRVATVAHQLGISTSELDAAFVTMTSKGVRASEAATQISGAMTALIKPSKDGAAAIRALGFDSGEALIEAYGFQGALQKLVDSTDGSTTAISKLVPRVRGLSFVLAATGESADIYRRSLKEIKNVTEEGLNTEFLRQMSTDAEKVTQEINRLRVFLTKDFGDALLSVAGGALRATGGAETLSLALTHLLPLLGLGAAAAASAGAAYAASALKTLVLAEATTGLGRAFRFAFGWFGIILAAYEALSFWQDKAEKAAERHAAAEAAAQEKMVDAARKAAAERVRIQEEEVDRVQALVAQRTARVTQAYNEELGAARKSNDDLVSQSKGHLTAMLRLREDYFAKLTRRIEQEKRLEETVAERQNETKRKREDDQFEGGLRGKSDVEQATKRVERAESLSAEARKLRSNPNATEADLRNADRLQRDAESQLDKVRALSKHEDNAADREGNAVGRAQEAARKAHKRVGKDVQGLDFFDAHNAIGNHGFAAKQEQHQANWAQRRAAQAANLQFGALRRRNPKIRMVGGQFLGGDADTRAQLQDLNRRRKMLKIGDDQDAAVEADAKAERALEAAKQGRRDADEIDALAGRGERNVHNNEDVGNQAQADNIKKAREADEAKAREAKEKFDKVQALSDEFFKNISQTDKKGVALPEAEQRERAQAAAGAARQIRDLTVDDTDPEFQKFVNELKRTVNRTLSDETIESIRVLPEAIEGVHDQFQKAFDDKPLRMKAQVEFASIGGRKVIDENGHVDPNELREGLKENTERLNKLQRDEVEAAPNKKAADTALAQAETALSGGGEKALSFGRRAWLNVWDNDFTEERRDPAHDVNGAFGQTFKAYHQTQAEQQAAYQALRSRVAKIIKAKPKDLSTEKIEELEQQLKSLADPNQFFRAAEGFEKTWNYKSLETAIANIKKFQSSQGKLNANEALTPQGKKELKTLRDANAGNQFVAEHEDKELFDKAKQARAKANATKAQLDAVNKTLGPEQSAYEQDVKKYNQSKYHSKDTYDTLTARKSALDQKQIDRLTLAERLKAEEKEADLAERNAAAPLQREADAKAAAQRAAYAKAADEKAKAAKQRVAQSKQRLTEVDKEMRKYRAWDHRTAAPNAEWHKIHDKLLPAQIKEAAQAEKAAKAAKAAQAGKQDDFAHDAKYLDEKQRQAAQKLADTQRRADETWDEHAALRDRLQPIIVQFNKDLDAYNAKPFRTQAEADSLTARKAVFLPDERRRDELFKKGTLLNQQVEIEKREAAEAERAAKAAGNQTASLSSGTFSAAKIAQFAQWTANGYERSAKAVNRIKPLAAPDALRDPNDLNVAAHGGTIRRFAFGGASAPIPCRPCSRLEKSFGTLTPPGGFTLS